MTTAIKTELCTIKEAVLATNCLYKENTMVFIEKLHIALVQICVRYRSLLVWLHNQTSNNTNYQWKMRTNK